MRKSRLNALLYPVLLVGCYGGNTHSDNQSAAISAESIGIVATVCEIRANKTFYIGKTVRLQAVYESDNSFYAHLIDRSCGSKRNLINVVSPVYATGDASVAAFFRGEDEKCPGFSVCPISVQMDVDVLVEKDEDGILLANFQRVYQVNWEAEESKGDGGN